MSKSILIFLLFANALCTHAKEGADKYVYKPLSISVAYQAGTFLAYGKGDVQLRTRMGQGAEVLLKSRITRKLSFNLGIHTRSFIMDDERYRTSLRAYFSTDGYYTSVYHYNPERSLRMQMHGLSFSVSGIYRFGNVRLEPFVKFNASFVSYSADSRVYLRNKDSAEYYIFRVSGLPRQFILLPAAGLQVVKHLSQAIAVHAGFEGGFSIGRQLLNADYLSRQYEYNSSSLQISTPKIYLMGTAGITLRPFKRLKKGSAYYDDAAYLKRFGKND